MASLPFLALIDLSDYSNVSQLPKAATYAGGVLASITAETIDSAFQLLKDIVGQCAVHLDITSIESQDDVEDLLDAGATKVFATSNQASNLDSLPHLDKTRIVFCATGSPGRTMNTIRGKSFGLYLDNVSSPEALVRQPQDSDKEEPALYVSKPDMSEADALGLLRQDAVPIIPAQQLTLTPDTTPNHIQVSSLILARAKSDRPDGLITTVVTDEQGVALGLVYSTKESVSESLRCGRGVYHSRKRGLWRKGDTSGDWQELIRIEMDCDHDCLRFVVRQQGQGFCHLGTATCFGEYRGLSKLQKTLQSRKRSAPEGSYTARLFNDSKMLNAKIMEEASELCEATSKENIAAEAADVLFFALTKATAAGVSLEDIERYLDARSVKIKRRKGDAKGPYAQKFGVVNGSAKDGRIQMRRFVTADESPKSIREVLKRPSQKSAQKIIGTVNPIVEDIKARGDKALLEYTHKFEKATSLTSPVLKAPFEESLMQLAPETVEAIDISYENIRKFHAAQKEVKPLEVETMPGVVCSRFSRPIERVGLYVPGGTAVLPSTALMLGVPAKVAGCKRIVIASPPRADGSLTPEIVYVAHKVGAESIVLAGGAQAVAAMAYGTENVSKVDKILGPGNQYVTAAKMIVSNDTTANVSIDMPAGPSEVLVIADKTANPAFVASDLLSQAEHGPDSQVVCIAVGLDDKGVQAIEDELHKQAMALPRVDIVRDAIEHSVTLIVSSLEEAMDLSNSYAPEHLILQVADPLAARDMVQNAGSCFLGPWTPESVGDYSAGVNHALPTYGYAKQYSGVNLGSYVKHITSSNLTREGLKNVGGAVMRLAEVEELEAHKRAVSIRLDSLRDAET